MRRQRSEGVAIKHEVLKSYLAGKSMLFPRTHKETVQLGRMMHGQGSHNATVKRQVFLVLSDKYP